MKGTCRLCAGLAVEGSDLCARHREAAARFSAAFAPASKVATAPDAATANEATPDAAKPADSAAPTADPLAETLDAALTPVWQQLQARIAEGDIDLAHRWPKLSCYFLNDLLHVRIYLTIIPPEKAGAGPVVLAPTWSTALAPSGELHQALLTHLRACEPELRRGSVQSLDLHLVTYAELAALNTHRPDGQEECRAVFVNEDGGWRSTTLDEIQPRLGHERWRTSNVAQSA